LQISPEGTPKKSCNDDMILSVFHMNADLKSGDFQKEAGWLLFSGMNEAAGYNGKSLEVACVSERNLLYHR
jgi:hypothetical protein